MDLAELDALGLPKRSGKVRDVYQLDDHRLLLVATDRISAFDWVLPTPIPDKGRVLTTLSAFWFDEVVPPGRHHLISTDVDAAGLRLGDATREALDGRVMVVRAAQVVPFECVVRRYLAGSAWREYRASGSVCGQALPAGLVEGDRISVVGSDLFTPATKAATGHDENVPFAAMVDSIGEDLAICLRDMSLALYEEAHQVARGRGLILADTKFEFGFDTETGQLILVDEVFTPDSSRYWDLAGYRPGGPQPSFDKQFVRDWLEATGWDKQTPPPPLPAEVVARTRAKYVDAFEALTGRPFAWK